MGKRKSLWALAVGSLFIGALSANAVVYTAAITNNQEPGNVVPTTSTGQPRTSNGNATFNINDAGTQIVVTATVNGIDVTGSQTADANDNLAAAHIHSGNNFPPTNNGVVWGFFGAPDHNTVNREANGGLVPFPTGVGGTWTITWDLDEGSLGNQTLPTHLPRILEGLGRAYINFHTVQFSGGEIRGGIVPEPSAAMLACIGAIGLISRRRRRA